MRRNVGEATGGEKVLKEGQDKIGDRCVGRKRSEREFPGNSQLKSHML